MSETRQRQNPDVVVSCTETKSTSQRLEFSLRAHRGELEYFLRIVWVLEFVPYDKTPTGRILSGNGTNILSTIKSNLKRYQNCRNCELRLTPGSLRKFENTSWLEERWTVEGNNMLTGDFRVFLVCNRQRKCLGTDRQNNVWCLEEDWDRYLRKDEQNEVLTVDSRMPTKLDCRSDSLCFCAVNAPSHVSSEVYTFTSLDGHVCQRSGPLERNTVWKYQCVKQHRFWTSPTNKYIAY